MQGRLWAGYCRALLAASVAAASERFPGRGEEAAERVHGVRKTLKEARALARLFLPSLGEPARVTIAALAVVRRRVGRARDLDVMEDRLGRLELAPDIDKALSAAIAEERAAAERAHTRFATVASRAQLSAIIKRLDGWDLDRVGDDDIAEAVGRTYRQGLRRGVIAFALSEPPALHALRARVVDLRYQLSALSPAWPAVIRAQSDELNALRDTLGDFNDLEVLKRFAAEHGGLAPEALTGLAERIEAKQKKLERRAAIEFARLYAETPDAFSMRLRAYLAHPVGKLTPPRKATAHALESTTAPPA